MALFNKLFKKNETHDQPNIAESRYWMIVTLVKDLTKAKYEKLKEVMDLVYESYEKNKSIKTPDQLIDEAGGFMLHNQEGGTK